MAFWTFYVSLLWCSSSVLAAQFGKMLAPQERSVAHFGGWALAAGKCPLDTTGCGSLWCCPRSLTCVHTGKSDTSEACCPSSTDCTIDLQSAPVCANSNWVLWNTGNPEGTPAQGETGYVCCLRGQKAQLIGNGANAICVDAGTPIPASLIGTLVGGDSSTATIAAASSTASARSSSAGVPASSASSSSPATTSAAAAASSATTASPALMSSASGASVASSPTGASSGASATPTTTASKNAAAENAVVSFGPLAITYSLGFLSWLLF